MAFAFQVQKVDRIALCFFGDGAANQGAFNESLNLAALWKLPVVFVCENNQYGLTVPLREHLAGSIAARAAGYGIPGVTVDGNDVAEMYVRTLEATECARRGDGPTLLEANTYRMTGFSTGDQGGYQPESEMQDWRGRDPIARLERALLEGDVLSFEAVAELRGAAVERVLKAREFAEASQFPTATSVTEDVFFEQLP
jgi:pyruvate dehydrogenase E1 component alpha subunit